MELNRIHFIATVSLLPLLAVAAANVRADSAGLFHDPDTGFSFREGYWSQSRSLDSQDNLFSSQIWNKSRMEIGSQGKAVFDGWVRDDNTFRGGTVHGDVREGYMAAPLGDFDFSVGREIFVWGKADGINPTDNLSVRDYTLLTLDDSDQKTGVFNTKITYNLPAVRITLLWLPEFRANTLPLPHEPYLNFQEESPNDQANEWAGRIENNSGDFDWSLSYFDGFNRNPDLALTGFSNSGAQVGLFHHRIRVIGTDGATTFGRYGLKYEIAYTFTQNPLGNDPQVATPYIFSVLGVERTVGENATIELEMSFRYVQNYQDPTLAPSQLQLLTLSEAILNQEITRTQYGITSRISKKWLNDTLEAELLGTVFLNQGDFAVRPKVLYSWTDHFKTGAGADYFRGPNNSVFGYLEETSNVHAEARWEI